MTRQSLRSRSRRRFTRLAALVPFAAVPAPAVFGRARARIVVVGGGAGGATAARYLAQAAGRSLAVTLVEPSARYRSCFFSNLYLGGLRGYDTLLHGYETLRSAYGIEVLEDRVVAIEPEARRLRLAGGPRLDYDRLVVAPGISLLGERLPGYDEETGRTMPHAWNGGPGLSILKRRLEAMADGGVFLMTVPDGPYRCPPGPYERISMIARYFRRAKPRARILVLDAKNAFPKQALFQQAWNDHYPGMIEWLPGDFVGAIEAIDAGTMTVTTAAGRFAADVASVIPPQAAGAIARSTGLADRSGWCPVDAATFESIGVAGVHLIGDAIEAGAMPKSAFSANSQAKACAAAVAALMNDQTPPEPRLLNTCWSFLADDDAVAISARYHVVEGRIEAEETYLSATDESSERRARTARQAESWYDAFTADCFG